MKKIFISIITATTLHASLQSAQVNGNRFYNKDLGPWRKEEAEPALYHEGSNLEKFLLQNELCPNLDHVNGLWTTSDLFTDAEKSTRENQKSPRNNGKDWNFIYHIKKNGLISIQVASQGALHLEKKAFVDLITGCNGADVEEIKKNLTTGSYKGLIFINMLSATLYNNQYVINAFGGLQQDFVRS